MKKIVAKLTLGEADSPAASPEIAGATLPIALLDMSGEVIAKTVISPLMPAELAAPDAWRKGFLRLTLLTGATEVKAIDLTDKPGEEVTFEVGKLVNEKWRSWAAPQVSFELSGREKRPKTEELSLDRYRNLWLRMWRFEEGEWDEVNMPRTTENAGLESRQMDLELPQFPHLLQLGSPGAPWRFMSLAGGGRCRLLFETEDGATASKAPPLRITMTGFRPEAEAIMGLLANDSLLDAATVMDSAKMAAVLMERKFDDPVAAAAGGYFLLRTDQWKRIPLDWWKNLGQHFNWVPDGALLHCVRLVRSGLGNRDAQDAALNLFRSSLNLGWPIYREGLSLLQEAASVLGNLLPIKDVNLLARVESLAVARASAGVALSFYGREPWEPSAVRWVGMPGAPRRRELAGLEWKEEVLDPEMLRELSGSSGGEVQPPLSLARKEVSRSFILEFAPKRAVKGIAVAAFEEEPEGDFAIELLAGRDSRGRRRRRSPRIRPNKPVLLLGSIGSEQGTKIGTV